MTETEATSSAAVGADREAGAGRWPAIHKTGDKFCPTCSRSHPCAALGLHECCRSEAMSPSHGRSDPLGLADEIGSSSQRGLIKSEVAVAIENCTGGKEVNLQPEWWKPRHRVLYLSQLA